MRKKQKPYLPVKNALQLHSDAPILPQPASLAGETFGLPTMKKAFSLLLLALLLCCTADAFASGKHARASFLRSKKILMAEVYADHRVTLYCGAGFDEKGAITLPEGFVATKHIKRAGRVEWEHVVPAENFGRFFTEWRHGHPECVDARGKPFKGRRCAEKTNKEFRSMLADMYNLYPAIGAVNASRAHFPYALLPETESFFGSCPVKIEGRKVEPPEASRGRIARSSLYMAATYAQFHISAKPAWHRMYPVDPWECSRAKRIKRIQGNTNDLVKEDCAARGLW